jgi:hypothetical protein
MRAVRHQFRRSSAPTSGARSACADSTGNAASGPAPPSSRPLPTCPPRLRLAPRAGARPPRRPRASPGSRLATATSSGAPDATVARRRRSPSFNVIAAVGRNRAGQGGMIEPLTEWLLAASPTKNQAAYEHFLGLLPGRPQVVTTDSDNAIGGAVATALPRQDAAPPEHAWASGTLAARCAADCSVRARRARPARGGARLKSSRPTGCASHPRPPPDRRRGHRRGRVLRTLTSTWSRTITPIGASGLRSACGGIATPRPTASAASPRRRSELSRSTASSPAGTTALGSMYYPSYFDGGYAIHGDPYVPRTPVSDGCIRTRCRLLSASTRANPWERRSSSSADRRPRRYSLSAPGRRMTSRCSMMARATSARRRLRLRADRWMRAKASASEIARPSMSSPLARSTSLRSSSA